MLNDKGGKALSFQNTMKALADPIRREILNMLKKGRMSAGDICEHFPVTGASVSRHLSVLKEADLIRDCREGKYIYYELNSSVLEEILLWIILIPIIIIVKVCLFFSWVVRKIFKRTKPKEESLEDKLYNLMENHLNCTRQ